jgi:hypothetical protein
MNNWEKLCRAVKLQIPYIKDERDYHKFFATTLQTIFNWDDDTIKNHVSTTDGKESKEADIVLKKGNNFGLVIEMKDLDINLDDPKKGKDQLQSYMRNFCHSYGLLVGNKMKVFYDKPTDGNQKELVEVACFDFNRENDEKAAAFCEILDMNKCSDEALKAYMLERIKEGPGGNGTGTPPPPPPPSKFDFHELIFVYNHLENNRFPAAGKNIHGAFGIDGNYKWQHIYPGWPKTTFGYYEFIDRFKKELVEITLHITNTQAGFVNFIENLGCDLNKDAEFVKFIKKLGCRGNVEYRHRTHTRLVISVPYDAGYEKIARGMVELIRLTKDKIDRQGPFH